MTPTQWKLDDRRAVKNSNFFGLPVDCRDNYSCKLIAARIIGSHWRASDEVNTTWREEQEVPNESPSFAIATSSRNTNLAISLNSSQLEPPRCQH